MAEDKNGRRQVRSAVISLGRGSASPPEDAIGMLLACHQRIRSFSALAVRLAAAEETPSASRAEAAASLHRYFTVALPLHVADEELSLKPRLIEKLGRGELTTALAEMSRQHDEIERRLVALAPSWKQIALAPERLDLLAAGRAGSVELERLFADHLALEEASILPAARHLSRESLATLSAEMRARREGADR